MGALSARRIASSVLSASLIAGVAVPAAAAADDSVRERSARVTAHAPVPDADALLAQVKSLSDLGEVLKPVADLLNAVLRSDHGRLPADEAAKLVDAVRTAVTGLGAAPAGSVTPSAPAGPATPAIPALPATPSLPAAPPPPVLVKRGDAKASGANLESEALTALQRAVDTLNKAVTAGDATQVVPAVTGVVTGLVNLLAATLLRGGLPAPDLPGLPPLPSLPPSVPTPPVSPPAR
ncbi:hypothetical protein PO587_03745 [Streptomyces gilvifuscus]|uniref:Secreted protein n=1 Tax=Streptomyces gilvifuscus TaxID=1550617 RepID=A0ABT5FM16_9ACTN|nr:hypothetical protein [Streptomyces gilvifuscus]MDC2953563.1 hypothetical protein [Streptomyces gilvifuscus]